MGHGPNGRGSMSDEMRESEEVGAGVLDALRGFYPVADDMPWGYHRGATLAQRYLEIEADDSELIKIMLKPTETIDTTR